MGIRAKPAKYGEDAMTRILTAAILLGASFFFVPAMAQEKPGEVTSRIVKYEGLVDAILKNRGKILVVDFWADYCAPCKARFPALVKFANEHAKEGLVVITVALDPLDGSLEPRADTIANIDRFLKKQNATFTNLILDENEEAWKKFNLQTIPSVYVFDREGKWSLFEPRHLAQNPNGPEDLVLQLLKQK
jgi:thiol-disulfide isomerase/thioredoxin